MTSAAVHRVVILALPDVVAMQAAITGQVFGHRDMREQYSVTVCTESPKAVSSTTGFGIQADAELAALENADTVVVPGFWPPDRPSEAVLSAVRAAAERGSRMVSFCTGSFALAEVGLLDGRSATTHWQEAEEFAARFRRVHVRPDVIFVDEGGIATSAGDSAAIDLCIHLVRNDLGAAAADRVARRMVAADPRSGEHAQIASGRTPASDWSLADTRDWALQHLADRMSVADLSAHAGVAPRTFARRFLAETGMTPLRWLTDLRLREALRLLEETDYTVERIAASCGLGTAANLRTVMMRGLGTVPSRYRSSFRRF